MSEEVKAFERWINTHLSDHPIAVDGSFDSEDSAVLMKLFANKQAPAIHRKDIVTIASRLNCSVEQIQAFAEVETNGGGFDEYGRPKILYERHKFWSLTKGRFPSDPYWNYAKAGNYTLDADKDGINDSYEKLLYACQYDPAAAFSACSWGKFQIMGFHWEALGYPSPFAMGFVMTLSEADQYDAFARFIEHEKLQPLIGQISTNPIDNIPAVLRYNGENAVTQNRYHVRIADAMRRLTK